MSLEYEPWPFLSKIQRLHLIIENHECTKIPMITGNTKCVFIDRSGISRNWNAKNYMYCHMVYILSDMNRNKLSYSRQLSCVTNMSTSGKNLVISPNYGAFTIYSKFCLPRLCIAMFSTNHVTCVIMLTSEILAYSQKLRCIYHKSWLNEIPSGDE